MISTPLKTWWTWQSDILAAYDVHNTCCLWCLQTPEHHDHDHTHNEAAIWFCNLIFLFIDKVLTKLPYPHPNPSYLTMWEEHSNPYLRSPFSCLFQVKGDLLRLSEIQEKTVSSHIFCYIKSDLNGIWTPLMLCIECLMQYSI